MLAVVVVGVARSGLGLIAAAAEDLNPDSLSARGSRLRALPDEGCAVAIDKSSGARAAAVLTLLSSIAASAAFLFLVAGGVVKRVLL